MPFGSGPQLAEANMGSRFGHCRAGGRDGSGGNDCLHEAAAIEHQQFLFWSGMPIGLEKLAYPYWLHVPSRLMKNWFFGSLLAGTGKYRHFRWLRAIENVSDPKTAFFGS